MIALASLIMLVVVPRMNASAPKPGEKPSPEFLKAQTLLPRLSVTATILGIVALLCVVLLKV
jgi:hypothetical protein